MDLLPGGNTSACKHWRLGKTGKPGPLWKFMAGAVVACVAIPWNSMQRKQVKPPRRWFGTWFVLQNKVVSLWTALVQSCCIVQPYSPTAHILQRVFQRCRQKYRCFSVSSLNYGWFVSIPMVHFEVFTLEVTVGKNQVGEQQPWFLGSRRGVLKVEINNSIEAKAELPASTLAAQLIWPLERLDQRNYCSLGGWLLY